jgi:hypothetical protein
MTTLFAITSVEKGILCCKHTGAFRREEARTLAGILNDYRGNERCLYGVAHCLPNESCPVL